MKKNSFKIKQKTNQRKKNTKGKRRQNKQKKTLLLLLLPVLFLLLLWGSLFKNEFKSDTIPFKNSSRIPVIDVSQWEGTINWEKVKNSGIHHAVLKIGSGDYNGEGFHEDPLFKTNYENAVRENISCGVYFFSYAVTADEAKREALYCLELLKKYDIEPSDLFFPVAFDLEYDKALQTGKRNCTDMTLAFCKTIEEAGFEPMIYSSASYLKDKLIYREIEDYKLWVANYEAAGPAFGKPYVMWQYSEDGEIDGIEDLCDLNYWYTSYIQVQELRAGTDSLTLKKGMTQTLDVKILPSNATNQRLNFSSSNEKAVKILDAQKGIIEAAGSGTAWITIETPSGIKERIRVKIK